MLRYFISDEGILKVLFLTFLIALLIGGIIGTSIDVFNLKSNSRSITAIYQNYQKDDNILSIRQIDSLSAAENYNFTIRNAVQR